MADKPEETSLSKDAIMALLELLRRGKDAIMEPRTPTPAMLAPDSAAPGIAARGAKLVGGRQAQIERQLREMGE